MASLWTPEGEHRVPRDGGGGADSPEPTTPPSSYPHPEHGEDVLSEEEMRAARENIEAIERELLDTPVEAIIANHCYGIFQLAAIHLGQSPPHLDEARVAIDAFATVVETLGDRFGPNAGTMRDALAQIRLAFVQISAAQVGGNGATAGENESDGAAH